MAYTTIKKPSDYFNTKLYTGNGGTLNVTGVGFQPDLVWIKGRGYADSQVLTDAVRGTTKCLSSDSSTAEFTQTNGLTAFGSDGFTLGNWSAINRASTTVAWNWLANGTGSANTDGTINSTVSANTTSGFSIVKWTGTGSSGTIGHGLGVAPKVVIVKRYSAAADWVYYTTAIDGSLDYLFLNTTAAKADSSASVPTSTVFSKSDTNNETQIAYCFAEKTGYSKFGTYTGNASTDGTFVYTGFKPAFILIKRADSTGRWVLWDSKRNPSNLMDNALFPNSSAVENDGYWKIDGLSNGFKIKDPEVEINASGATFIYMAFAEEPLVGDNPCTAR